MVEIVRGELVVLRERVEDDCQEEYAWRCDDELASLDASYPLRMRYDQFLRYFREELEFPSPWSHRLAIDTLAGTHIGNAMYYDIDLIRKQTEFGIMVGNKDYWSQGYGSDAFSVLTSYVFTNSVIEMIYLHTLEWNTRARISFAKCGFREIGPVNRGGYDFIRMEISKSDWLVSQK
jgi:RimJ/RimL family protein N-acetyltransferase